MSVLDERIRRLAPAPETSTPVEELRGRARRRRNRRRGVAGAGAVVAVLLVVLVVTWPSGTDPESVVAGPPDTTPSGQITFGDADGVQLRVSPATDLVDGQVVTVSATGLDPNRVHRVVQCAPAIEDASACFYGDGPTTEAVSDSSGSISVEVGVGTVVWSAWDGAVDCTARECHLLLLDDGFSPVALSGPLGFAAGVEAPTPRLVLEPVGPYADGQEVVVRGDGFVPGTPVAGHVGQCPARLDTRREERCSYSDIGSSDVVGPDGTFVSRVVLQESLLFTGSCREGAGCVVGWVIPQGPLVAPVPVTFE